MQEADWPFVRGSQAAETRLEAQTQGASELPLRTTLGIDQPESVEAVDIQ